MVGRDGCRVPIPWHGDAPSYGFGPAETSWLPQPAQWAALSRAAQTGVDGSTLELYRTALELRRSLGLGLGELTWAEGYDSFETIALHRPGGVLVIANLGEQPVAVPDGATVLVASAELIHTDAGLAVPTDVTVWLGVSS